MSSVAALVLASACVAGPPDVFFITMDTIRADRMGMYGHVYPTSPNLDALAEQSLVFDDMICEVPLTSPSFCSMLSSRFPRLTGTTRNGLRMPDDVPLIQEVFQAAGYETVAVQSNWTLKAKLSGLDRGFEAYDDGFKQRRWFIMKSERDARDVTRLAKEVVAARDSERPMFGWFHYSDPHAPYKMHRRHDVARGFEHEDKRAQKVFIRYDSEIRYADKHIGDLLDVLPKENAIIVFVGDHGESIYEHDYLGHGRHVYQPCMRVPFFIQAPGMTPGRTELPVRGIDVGPTLLGLAGLELPGSMLGENLAAGLPAAHRIRVVETYGGAVPRLPGMRAMMAGKGPIRQAVYDGPWKLIEGEEETLLFNLAADPLELNNLASAHPERTAELRAAIGRWNQENPAGYEAEVVELNEDDIEAMTTLGYIE